MNDSKKGHDTNTTFIIGRKKAKLFYTLMIPLTVIVLAIVYFLIPEILGDKGGDSPQIRQMGKLTSKIGKLETEVHEKQNELINLLKEYTQKTGEPPPTLGTSGLSDEEKRILKDKIINSKDVTLKSFIEDILRKNNEISEIKKAINRYEKLLPEPHIVKKGESHYQIAMDFLINKKKVVKGRALWLVERTALFESITPDFKVWNFYFEDEYGTFITQGNATKSPNKLRKEAKKKLIDARNKEIAEKERLSKEIEKLKSRRAEINLEVKDLRNEKKKLDEQNKRLNKDNQALEKTIHSLSYMVDLKGNLVRKDILKSGFLRSPRLRKIPLKFFEQPIDLRNEKKIEIFAKKLKLGKIEKITLYPKFYEEGIDYEVKIEEGGQKAVLTILADDQFKKERVIISVE